VAVASSEGASGKAPQKKRKVAIRK